MADYDVIVIGAGLGGLSLGALMAKRGRKTLIVEQSPRVGGYCSTFERDGFRFDLGASIIEIIDVIEGCFKELGTSVFNEVEMVPLEPIYTIKFKDSTEMRYPTSKEETAEEFRKISPRDAEGWLKYADYMQGFLDTALTGFFLEPANTLGDMLKMFLKTPKLLSYMPLFNMNYQDVISKYFSHPKIQEALAFQSNFMGLPPELCPGHMTMLPWAEHTGFYYSKGGMIAIPEALRKIGERNGMEIMLDTEVKSLLIQNGRAEGVTLSSGEQISAGVVVSNINAKSLYFDLVGEEHLGSMARKGLKSLQPSTAALMLYLGLDSKPELSSHHTLCTLPMDALNDYYWNVYKQGKIPDEQFGLISWTSLSDPDNAPKGNHSVVMTLACPNDLATDSWDAVRERVIDETIAFMSKTYVPGLKNQVKTAILGTPDDYERNLLAPQGAIYMFHQDAATSTVFRPASRSKSIRGLYLTGASTHPGGGIPSVMASGLIAAELIEKHEKL